MKVVCDALLRAGIDSPYADCKAADNRQIYTPEHYCFRLLILFSYTDDFPQRTWVFLQKKPSQLMETPPNLATPHQTVYPAVAEKRGSHSILQEKVRSLQGCAQSSKLESHGSGSFNDHTSALKPPQS